MAQYNFKPPGFSSVCKKKTLKWNSNVSKVKTLCGATSNVQQMARGQSVIPVELIFLAREDQQEL